MSLLAPDCQRFATPIHLRCNCIPFALQLYYCCVATVYLLQNGYIAFVGYTANMLIYNALRFSSIAAFPVSFCFFLVFFGFSRFWAVVSFYYISTSASLPFPSLIGQLLVVPVMPQICGLLRQMILNKVKNAYIAEDLCNFVLSKNII